MKLFREQLDYAYLGDWNEREGNSNVEEDLLRAFLREERGHDDALVTRALHVLGKAARDAGKSLYDRIRAALQTPAARGASGMDITKAELVHDPPIPAESLEERVERLLELVRNQDEY